MTHFGRDLSSFAAPQANRLSMRSDHAYEHLLDRMRKLLCEIGFDLISRNQVLEATKDFLNGNMPLSYVLVKAGNNDAVRDLLDNFVKYTLEKDSVNSVDDNMKEQMRDMIGLHSISCKINVFLR